MRSMIDELVPAEYKDFLDFSLIGDLIWQYTLGNITAYELTIEVAVSQLGRGYSGCLPVPIWR